MSVWLVCTPSGGRSGSSDGDDVICVPDPSDHLAFHVIDAKAGNDIILGGDGVDWVYGGPGDDTVYGRGGDDVIDAGPGADTVYGGDGFDTIRSDDLSDTVTDSASGHEIIIDAPPAPRSGPVTNDDREHAAPAATLTVDMLGNDYDPDGDLDYATLRITQQSAAGTARIAAPGHSGAAVEYTAGPADRVDTFTYEICDRLGACASAQVTVTVGTTGCTIAGADRACGLRPNGVIVCWGSNGWPGRRYEDFHCVSSCVMFVGWLA